MKDGGSRTGAGGSRVAPVLALLVNAATWGLSWWPFRELQSVGLHPLWATALIYAVAVAVISLVRGAAWGQLLRARPLWLLVLASGTTNAAFNWGVTVGDVVRVVLLFYLMPLWAVLLAWPLLGERPTRASLARVALALGGAMVVLWPPAGLGAGGLPLPRTLAEWLAVLGGFSFALNNVLLRRHADEPEAARALAMFIGGTLVSALLALTLMRSGEVPALPLPQWPWVAGALAMSAAFLVSNLALQYGAARLPAHVTAVVMITEVLFASLSALLFGAGQLTPALALGGAMIVAAALLAGHG